MNILQKLPSIIADVRKAAAAVAGAGGQIIILLALHGQALHYAQVIIGIATAITVWVIPNGGTLKSGAKDGSKDNPALVADVLAALNTPAVEPEPTS